MMARGKSCSSQTDLERKQSIPFSETGLNPPLFRSTASKNEVALTKSKLQRTLRSQCPLTINVLQQNVPLCRDQINNQTLFTVLLTLAPWL